MTRRPATEARDARPRRLADALVLALRMRDVSGARIGEALAEVEQFCADCGHDAQDGVRCTGRVRRSSLDGDRGPHAGRRLRDDLRDDRSDAASASLVLVRRPGAAARTTVTSITLGWLLAVPAILAASVLVVRVAVDDVVQAAQDEAAGVRRRRWGSWAVTAARVPGRRRARGRC